MEFLIEPEENQIHNTPANKNPARSSIYGVVGFVLMIIVFSLILILGLNQSSQPQPYNPGLPDGFPFIVMLVMASPVGLISLLLGIIGIRKNEEPAWPSTTAAILGGILIFIVLMLALIIAG